MVGWLAFVCCAAAAMAAIESRRETPDLDLTSADAEALAWLLGINGISLAVVSALLYASARVCRTFRTGIVPDEWLEEDADKQGAT